MNNLINTLKNLDLRKRYYTIKECSHCKKTSVGVLGDKFWFYGRGKSWGEADCHYCGARNRADIKYDSGIDYRD